MCNDLTIFFLLLCFVTAQSEVCVVTFSEDLVPPRPDRALVTVFSDR